jgi:hypothetical protein
MYMDGVEDQAVTITDVGTTSSTNHDAALLARRNPGIIGVDVTYSTIGTCEIEVDFGVSTTVDYFLLGGITITDAVSIDFHYWNGSSYSVGTSGISIGDLVNSNFRSHVFERTATKFKIDININDDPLKIGTIFIGQRYEFPYNYDYNNRRGHFSRVEQSEDRNGYPNSDIIASGLRRWGIQYRLKSDAEMQALETEFTKIAHHAKPFYFLDEGFSTTVPFFVKNLDKGGLRPEQPAPSFYIVDLNLEELSC